MLILGNTPNWLFALGLAAAMSISTALAKPEISLKLGKVVVATADGTVESTHKLLPYEPIASPLTLSSPDSVLKISFTMVDESTEGSPSPVIPRQAHVMFKDVESGKSVNLPLVVKKDGKAKLDLKVSSLPTSLRSSSGTHQLTLLLASPTYTPLQYPFLTLTLPSSSLTPNTRRWSHEGKLREGGLPAFEKESEIVHTFGVGEKEVGVMKVAVGTVGVWAPWLVLFALLTQVASSMKTRSPPASIFPFLLSLIALEGLILKYWIHWKLYEFLPWFAGVGLISTYLGKIALSQVQTRRSSEVIKHSGSSENNISKETSVVPLTAKTVEPVSTASLNGKDSAHVDQARSADVVLESPVVAVSSGVEPTAGGTPVKKRKGKK